MTWRGVRNWPFLLFFGQQVNGRLPLLHTLTIQLLQLADEEEVSDLLNGDEGIGEAGGPEEGPEVVDFAAELRRKHLGDL